MTIRFKRHCHDSIIHAKIECIFVYGIAVILNRQSIWKYTKNLPDSMSEFKSGVLIFSSLSDVGTQYNLLHYFQTSFQNIGQCPNCPLWTRTLLKFRPWRPAAVVRVMYFLVGFDQGGLRLHFTLISFENVITRTKTVSIDPVEHNPGSNRISQVTFCHQGRQQ